MLILHLNRGWESLGGYIEEGEEVIDASAHEIMEEAGLRTRIGTLVAISKCAFIHDFPDKPIGGELRHSAEHANPLKR